MLPLLLGLLVMDRRDRDRERRKSRERKSSKERDRKRKRSQERRKSKDREKDRDRDKERDERRRRDEKEKKEREQQEREDRERTRQIEEEERKRKEELRLAEEEAELCERDKRTVFVYHLHPKVDSKVLSDFFAKAGKVRDVRLITDKKTGKSKGFGYIEFYDPGAVVGALAMQGYELMGHPVMVKVSEAEKNVVNTTVTASTVVTAGQGSARLYVGNLHPKITEGDLKMVFSELGEVDKVEVPKDLSTGQGRGYAYVRYRNADDAKKALVQLNSVELAGQKIKVGLVNETEDPGHRLEDGSLNAQSRAILMQKLGAGPLPGVFPAIPPMPGGLVTPGVPSLPGMIPGFATGMMPGMMPGFPNPAMPGLMGFPALTAPPPVPPPLPPSAPAPPPPPPSEDEIPSPCLLLMNLFDPAEETESDFDEDIKEDVAEECNKHGRLVHVWVDKHSAGWVYLKFDGVDGSKRTYDNLNRRWFAKRMITAKFIPEAKYRDKFGV
jgi:RNA-binding protein 39